MTELKKIKLTNKGNFLKAKEINLGFGTRKCITDLKKSDLLSTKDHATFINDCISFITVIVSKLFGRSPLLSVIVRNANALNPNETACREDEILQEKMNLILKHFLKLKIFSPPKFLEEVRRVNSHELGHSKTWEANLDDYSFKKLDVVVRRYRKFLFVLKIILTLSHGQTTVERGFSFGKPSLQVNKKEELNVAKKIVRDHPLATKTDLPYFEIPKKLIIACNTTHSKYKASLEKAAKDSAKVLEKERREVFEKELKELEDKEKKVIRTCESLEGDSTKYSFEAETKSDLEARKLMH